MYQRRRRVQGRMESEVYADFFFLSSTGEDMRRVRADNLRVLVLTERMSGMMGAVVPSSDVAQTRTKIVKWLREFGLESGTASIVLVTDAEEAVSDLVAGASGEFSFQVRKAAPQDHEANGLAERALRNLREALQTLRADLNQEQLDVCFNVTGFSIPLLYLCGSLNGFSKAHGSDFAPCDVAVGRHTPKRPPALFGASVLAELPQSVRDLAPNMSRYVEAAFLRPVLSSQAIKVFAFVRIEGRVELKFFQAQSVKLCVPLTQRIDLLEGIVGALGSGPRKAPPAEPRETLEPPVSLEPPASGPPASWVRDHGATVGGKACSNRQEGKKAGRSHNASCCRRYAVWLSAACCRRYAVWLRETLSAESVGIQQDGQGSSRPQQQAAGGV